MGESQVPFQYDVQYRAAIRTALSDPRFETYLMAAGFEQDYAIALYLYNARLAKAFLFPIHMAEVCLRNAMDELFVKLHGQAWPTDPGFRSQLTPQSLQTLDSAVDRANVAKHGAPTRGDIVSKLTFDFWSNLFRPEYDRAFWQTNLRQLLPYMPKGYTRADIQLIVKDVNGLRNRIAHHEPILGENATKLATDAIGLVAMINAFVADWLKQHTTVGSVIRGKPGKNGYTGPTMGERCDSRFQTVTLETKLFDVLAAFDPAAPAIVCVDPTGLPVAVFQSVEILQYVAGASSDLDGLIDFNDFTIADFLGKGMVGPSNWQAVAGTTPMAGAVSAFKRPGMRALLVLDAGGAITGVLLRAHRRY